MHAGAAGDWRGAAAAPEKRNAPTITAVATAATCSRGFLPHEIFDVAQLISASPS